MILRMQENKVDGSRLESLSGTELLELLKMRVADCTDKNPVPANAFRAAAPVVEVLNAWIRCGQGDARCATRTDFAKFMPDLYNDTN